jgi:hypothetical protein
MQNDFGGGHGVPLLEQLSGGNISMHPATLFTS